MLLEREAVYHRTVHAVVVDADRVVGECLVEVVAIEQVAVEHDGFVVAVAHDYLSPFGILRSAANFLSSAMMQAMSLPGPDGGA
jgi:hypothetical protein